MRIVHVITRFNRGGTASWLKILIREQVKQGHDVFLLSGYVQENEIEDYFFNSFGGVRISTLGRKLSISNDLKSFLSLRSQLSKIKPDIINTHTSKAGLIGRLVVRTLPQRPTVIHTYHGHILYGYFSKFLVSAVVILEKTLSSFTDLSIVSGRRVMEELIERRIADESKFYLVRPGVEIKDGQKVDRSKDSLSVGWLGRLEKIKRPDRVISLAKNFPNLQFLIGGEGSLLETLKIGAPKNVKFLGWVEANSFWLLCDLALLTSENEAQPISLVEAAMHGLPIIAEDVGSVSEVFEDGISGILVKDSSSRVEALNLLSKNEELRLTMGVAAMKFANSRFGVDQFITSHEEAYKIAIQNHNLL